ncbi:MAG: hypothetical protein AAFY39_17870 [Pseudomonadota bacterium]
MLFDVQNVWIPLAIIALLVHFMLCVGRFWKAVISERNRLYGTVETGVDHIFIPPPSPRTSKTPEDIAYRRFYARGLIRLLAETAVLWTAVYLLSRV